jgi:uncharacterized protein (DUF58 family)
MLRDAWIWIALGLIITGLVVGDALVAALGFGVGIACGVAQLWSRWSVRRLKYERVLHEDHAFTGERFALTTRLTNEKPLPLPWVEVRDRFPEALLPEANDEFVLAGQVGSLQNDWRTSAGAHQRVNRDIELRAPERGVYDIGPARVRSGDLFGLFSEEIEEPRHTKAVVYPRTVAIEDLGLPTRRPYGETPRGIRIFEDPSRVAGLRDYAPGDSLRRIDWNATARIGKLQSRVYDPTSSQHLLLCLNTQTIEPSWAGYVPELLERGITVAASIARDAYDRRYSVGLLATGTFPDADRSIRIAPGRRPEQFIRILEALAIITPFVLEPLSAMLDREEHRLTIGTTIAVVTGIMPDELAATILRLRRRGHNVVVLSTGIAMWSEQLGDVPVINVSHVDWRPQDAAVEAAP